MTAIKSNSFFIFSFLFCCCCWIRDGKKSGSGTNIPDLQHWVNCFLLGVWVQRQQFFFPSSFCSCWIRDGNLLFLVAVFRDTEVCIVPASLLEFLKVRSTAVLSKLVQVLGNRLLSLRPRASSQQLPPRQQQQHKLSSVGSGVELTSGRIHYDSVAVITISKGKQ